MGKDELTDSEKQRVKTTLEQLQSIRDTLYSSAAPLREGRLTPAAVEPGINNQWYPQAQRIVLKYLDSEHAEQFANVIGEQVVEPVLDPMGGFTEAVKEAAVKLEWSERYLQKLAKVDSLIEGWQNRINADQVGFIKAQKTLSLKNKTELNLPARGILFFVCLAVVTFIAMLSPAVKFASGFSNPHLLLTAFVVLGGFILATIFLQKKEFWFGCALAVAVGLLPFFCLPVPSNPSPPAKPDAAKPEAAKPEAQKKPDAAKPEAAKPEVQKKPDAAKPEAAKPEVQKKPDAAKPEAAKPEVQKKPDVVRSESQSSANKSKGQ